MSRFFPPTSVQADSHRLRNEICRLGSPTQMAQVSSHLRNFAVAEVIGFIGMLDGHPGIKDAPAVAKAPANSQQAQGTPENPFAHAIPSDMLLNGDRLIEFYKTPAARRELERTFGMGVMAPEDWETTGAFPHQPRQNNVVDTIAERHHYGGGLVDAFKECVEEAVDECEWDGSGEPEHDLDSLTTFIREIYTDVWVPRARAAYQSARLHFAAQIAKAPGANAERLAVLKQRRDIVEAQIEIFERDTSIAPEAARNVWKFVSAENWA